MMGRIRISLIPKRGNRQILETAVHIDFEDFSVVAYEVASQDAGIIAWPRLVTKGAIDDFPVAYISMPEGRVFTLLVISCMFSNCSKLPSFGMAVFFCHNASKTQPKSRKKYEKQQKTLLRDAIRKILLNNGSIIIT